MFSFSVDLLGFSWNNHLFLTNEVYFTSPRSLFVLFSYPVAWASAVIYVICFCGPEDQSQSSKELHLQGLTV